ncbi:MAG TPA: SMC family ATPase [Candidatus Eisenbacteria bacterium]|nr:SMC family ATPase [Candidatus Eisenbacteria bacterium]
MKIEIVQLENIRSHVKSTIPFARGFNCLVGGLGCGKSSILYSIDFALFGDPVSRSFDYLLREDSASGKVTVQFSHNGRTYTISRGLKRRGKGISQDSDELKLFEEENLLSSGANEAVGEQLKTITGLDRELFREIVWVRQEHLKEFLDFAPRERQRRLDDLFGLSDYENAWASLAGYQKEYEGEKKAYERDSDVAGMEKLGGEYDKVAEEFSLAEIAIQDAAKQVASARKTLEEAESRLKQLENVKAQNEKLKHKEAELRATLTNLQDNNASAIREIESKDGSIGNLKKRLNVLEAQAASHYADLKEIGVETDQSFEGLKRSIATYDERLAGLRGEQEVNIRNIRADQKRLSSLAEQNVCPLCSQNLTDNYRKALAEQIEDENGKRQSRIDQLTTEISDLQRQRSKANTSLSTLQGLLPRIADLESRIKEETEGLAKVRDELEQRHLREQQLTQELAAVQNELGRFDVSRLEAAKTTREQAVKQYYTAESDLHTSENRKKDLLERLDVIKARIDVAQQKIERMQKILKAFEIISVMRDAFRSIQPKLRGEFVAVLRNFVQQVLDNLVRGEGSFMNVTIDETYTPCVVGEGGTERDATNLSGGERTLLAFAYRIGLGQLIMQSRTGHGLSMLLLDEPTESLGSEDGSIERLAEAISRFKAIEQAIAVTHSDAFAEKAEHVIRLEKEAGVSRVSVEK